MASKPCWLPLLPLFPHLAHPMGPAANASGGNMTGASADGSEERWDLEMMPKDSVCALLIGFMVFVMALTYLVHWPDRDIRLVTWKLISSTLSIFVAVMLNTVVVSIVTEKISNYISIQISTAVGFLGLWLLVQALLFCRRGDRLAAAARGNIGGHMMGFTAIEAFGSLQDRPPFRDSIWLAILVLPLFFLVWAVLSFIALRVRSRVEANLESTCGSDEEAEAKEQCEEFEDLSQESENDAVGITLGFLITQVVSFAIVGELPPREGEPRTHTKFQDHMLFVAAVGFLLAVFAFEATDHDHNTKRVKRLYDVARGVVAMSMSWCWLFWGRWHLWRTVQMEELMAKVVLAGSTSLFCMTMVFVCDTLADRGGLNPRALRALIQAFGLLIGFAWEDCFDAVSEDLRPTLKRDLSALGLVIFVVPGWRLYILPRAMDAWHSGLSENPPPATSLCFVSENGDALADKQSSSDSES